jgi:three-Cys-motif partner protein
MAFSKVTSNEELNNARRNKKTVQGASKFTEKKEYDFLHLVKIRVTQMKTQRPYFDGIRNLVVVDLFCGVGTNEVRCEETGVLKTVHGSPFSVMGAIDSALKVKNPADPDGEKIYSPKGLAKRNTTIVFNDIREHAAKHAYRKIEEVYPNVENGVWRPCPDFSAKIRTSSEPAKHAVRRLNITLREKRDSHAILIVDPNGPADFPREEIIRLIKDHPGRVDLIMYLSATSIRRCMGAAKSGKINFDWLNGVEGLDAGFILSTAIKGRTVWIREPLKGDPQHWMMIPSFTQYPRLEDAWSKNGFADVNTPRGKELVNLYSGVKEAV